MRSGGRKGICLAFHFWGRFGGYGVFFCSFLLLLVCPERELKYSNFLVKGLRAPFLTLPLMLSRFKSSILPYVFPLFLKEPLERFRPQHRNDVNHNGYRSFSHSIRWVLALAQSLLVVTTDPAVAGAAASKFIGGHRIHNFDCQLIYQTLAISPRSHRDHTCVCIHR